MQFQEADGRIFILYNNMAFHGTTEQFQQYEPDYISSGDYIRIWTEGRACLNDYGNDFADPDYSLDTLIYYCGRIADYIASQPSQDSPVPAETRADRLQRLNDDLHSYLTMRGYDQGTQISFQAVYIDLQELPELTETQAQVKANIRQAWDFVHGIVLPQYYQWKAQLGVIEDFLSYSWGFHALDAADPCVSLREIMLLLQEA